MGVNRVTITGNLTRDPELRVTTNGTQVMNFGVAVNDRRRNQQTGEWHDEANFIDCVLFGQRAQSLSRVLRKGTKVAIDGKLRQSTWEKDGQRRSRIEVLVDDIDLMSRRDGGNQGGGNQGGGYGGNAPVPQPPRPQDGPPRPGYRAHGPANGYQGPYHGGER